MTRFFAAAGAAALVLASSLASAQDAPMYVTTDSSGNRMVMGGDMTEGAPLVMGENGAAPADCPAGTFYEGAQNQIFACDGDMSYTMSEMEAGMTMPDGTAFPEGAMMLEARENQN